MIINTPPLVCLQYFVIVEVRYYDIAIVSETLLYPTNQTYPALIRSMHRLEFEETSRFRIQKKIEIKNAVNLYFFLLIKDRVSSSMVYFRTSVFVIAMIVERIGLHRKK